MKINFFRIKDVINKNANSFVGRLLLFLSVLGPGLITANIDNDAGGIATYSMTGALTGYRLLWTLLPITIALIFVQEMCSRMGIVSGKGLADLIREKFGLKITFYILIFLIIADFGNTTAEFAGIASAGEIFGISKYFSVPLCALLVWLFVVKGDYKIVERFFLVGCTLYISYIICGFITNPPWREVITNLYSPNPTEFKSTDLPMIVGLIGTTITPWMQFYLQAAIVEKGLRTENLMLSRLDVIFGCLFMFLVTLFIVICCAVTLHGAGIQINTAADAAIALKPLAGKYSGGLFAIGLFNASFFAAALLPLATSYYVCEGMGWEHGVDKTFKEAPHFFTIFTALIFLAMVTILIPRINLFGILIWSQIINGVLIPIVIFFVVQLCNDPDIMGEHTNSGWFNFICYTIMILMSITNAAMIYFEVYK